MHSVPYFAQPATPKNIQGALNTIASKRTSQLDVVYPVDPTGVVTKVQDMHVTLTMLDTNSGISKDVYKRQQLDHFTDLVISCNHDIIIQ